MTALVVGWYPVPLCASCCKFSLISCGLSLRAGAPNTIQGLQGHLQNNLGSDLGVPGPINHIRQRECSPFKRWPRDTMESGSRRQKRMGWGAGEERKVVLRNNERQMKLLILCRMDCFLDVRGLSWGGNGKRFVWGQGCQVDILSWWCYSSSLFPVNNFWACVLGRELSSQQINQLTVEKWKILSCDSLHLTKNWKTYSFIHQSVNRRLQATSACQSLGSMLEIEQPKGPALFLVSQAYIPVVKIDTEKRYIVRNVGRKT